MDVTHDAYAAFRFRGFRWFTASLLAQTLGIQMQGVVVGWQVYQHTRDALALGLIGLAEAIPFVGIALYAGHVADRINRRRLTLVALALLVLCAASLFILTAVDLVRPGHIWPVYVVVFVSGIARSFLQPARTALGAEVVPRALYPNAVGWRTSTWQVGAVLGPAVGGLLYGLGSARTAYAADTVLMLGAWLTLARVESRDRLPTSAGESFRQSLVEGLRFVRSRPVLLGALSLDLFAVLFGGAEALLPIFAADILKVGPSGLGVLRAAPAIGSVVTALVLAHRRPLERAGRSLVVAVALFGICMIGFGLSRNFLLSWLLLACGGMADNVSVVLRSNLVQILTPPPLLGRVSSVNAIFVGSSNEIGAFESGVAARILGAVPAVVAGGVMTLIVVAVTAWRVPALLRLGRIE